MVNTPRPEAQLTDLESFSFTHQDILFGYAHVGKADVHMAVRGIIMAKHVHRPQNLNARRVNWDKDLALLTKRIGIGGCFHHCNHDLTTWITSTRNIVFLAVNDPLAIL